MPRNLSWTHQAWQEYLYWHTQDKKTLKRIHGLIEEIKRTPFEGVGKPEPLRANLSGYWSRRIDQTNRLVYAVAEHDITIVACRFHYGS